VVLQFMALERCRWWDGNIQLTRRGTHTVKHGRDEKVVLTVDVEAAIKEPTDYDRRRGQ